MLCTQDQLSREHTIQKITEQIEQFSPTKINPPFHLSELVECRMRYVLAKRYKQGDTVCDKSRDIEALFTYM